MQCASCVSLNTISLENQNIVKVSLFHNFSDLKALIFLYFYKLLLIELEKKCMIKTFKFLSHKSKQKYMLEKSTMKTWRFIIKPMKWSLKEKKKVSLK